MKWIVSACFLIFLSASALGQNAVEVYINEIRANDLNTDDVEFIELIGPAGTNISGFVIVHYDGANVNDGEVWRHTIGTFTIPNDGVLDDDGVNVGFYVAAQSGAVPNGDAPLPGLLQNGNGDGLILYDGDPSSGANILDAVSWDGVTDIDIDDPGTVSTGVDSNEDNYLHQVVDDDNTDFSIQAPNSVFNDDGSGWALDNATPGALNASQVSGDIVLPVSLSSFTARLAGEEVVLNWVTESEVDNIGFEIWRNATVGGDYTQIGWQDGQFTTNERTQYSFSDDRVISGTIYSYLLVDVDVNGVRTQHGPIEVNTASEAPTVDGFYLYANYPNPFNPTTTLKIQVPVAERPQNVKLEIFNSLGQRVRVLQNGQMTAGTHEIEWNGLADNGSQVTSGLYFAVLRAGNVTQTIKMALLK